MNSKWKMSSLSLGLAASLVSAAAPAAQAPGCETPQYYRHRSWSVGKRQQRHIE